MSDDKVFDSLIRIHEKIDDLKDDISDIKVAQANLPCDKDNLRIKILEKIVYGGVAIILISFLIFLTGDKTTNKAAAKTKIPTIQTK